MLLPEAAASQPRSSLLPLAYLLCLLGLLTTALLWYPIVYPDSDLWFHLSTGKYIIEHRGLPEVSFFSFISPPREWPIYFWLFQILVYGLYRLGGYQALIFFRAMMYVGMMAVLLRYLWRGQRDPRAVPWLTFVTVACAFCFFYRYSLVRPHQFTYLFIVVFLYILEFHPKRAGVLPLLGVLWCNLHGAVYPVMLLLTGAYALEYLVGRFRGKPYDASEARTFFVPLVVTMATVYLTPLGWQLLGIPFRPLGYQSAVTSELMPFSLEWLATGEIIRLAPSTRTFFSLFFLATCLAALRAISKGRFRISHALLFIGGLALLPKAQRFTHEFMLLSLPLLRANPIAFSLQRAPGIPRRVSLVLAGLLLIMPFSTLKQSFTARGQYPFSRTGLPEGIVTFLSRVGATGRILTHPNAGGYVRWMLHPQYTIFMDMETFFTDEDFYLGLNFVSDQQVLDKLLVRYEPSFIMVPFRSPKFTELITKAPQYVPVFFDDAEVLYVHRLHHPAIAERYELKTLRPFEFFNWKEALETNPIDDPAAFEEIRRLLAVYPEGGGTNVAVADRLIQDGAYDRALPYAETIIEVYPEFSEGYWLKGEALKGLGLSRQAERYYRAALPRASPHGRLALYKKLGRLSFERGQYRHAYRLLKRGIDGLSPDTPIEDFYALGIAALSAGEEHEAEIILTFLQEYKIPSEETAWRDKVASVLAGMNRGDAVRKAWRLMR